MNSYTNEFSFKKIADNAYSVTYRVVDEKGNFIAGEKDWVYTPRGRAMKNMNDVRNVLSSLFYARKIAVWKLDGPMKNVCTNPASDFKTKAELIREAFAKKREEAVAKVVAAQKPAPSVVPSACDQALYEVVCKNGVWTIIKHDQPLYTAEQAKTVLFQKIVNG